MGDPAFDAAVRDAVREALGDLLPQLLASAAPAPAGPAPGGLAPGAHAAVPVNAPPTPPPAASSRAVAPAQPAVPVVPAPPVAAVHRPSAHPALAPWTEATVKFSTYVKPGAWDTSPFLHFFAGGPGTKELDVTALVADWVSGALPNRGIVLAEPKHDKHLIFSSESSKSHMRPRLEVCYSVP